MLVFAGRVQCYTEFQDTVVPVSIVSWLQDVDRRTALYLAGYNNHTKVVEVLLVGVKSALWEVSVVRSVAVLMGPHGWIFLAICFCWL